MPSEALQALREELLSHLNTRNPTLDEILEGLHELGRHEMSELAHIAVQEQITSHNYRVDLLKEGLDYLNRLEQDQYPDKPGNDISFPIKTELEREHHVEGAAIGSFNVVTPATSLGLKSQETQSK